MTTPIKPFLQILIFFVGIFSYRPAYAELMVVDEMTLIRMAKTENPSISNINAQMANAVADQAMTQSEFDPKLSGSYSYASSREDAIIQFFPVFRPQKNMQIGLEQKISYGATVKTGVFSQQLNTADGFINNATQVGAQLGVEIDIWKNFLGRLDRSQLQSKKISRQVSELQSQINKRSFVLDVRKVYWSLVAIENSLDLSKQLVTTAKKQLRDSKKRNREGLSDRGDIARNQAQLQSRESSVLFFSYQRELLISQLRSLLPGLSRQDVRISRNIGGIEQKVRRCVGMIAINKELQTQHTDYDEIVKLLNDQKEHELRVAGATDSLDIKLQAQYQTSGVSESHSEAFDRLTDDFKNGYQVGVAVNIPLGGDLSKSRSSRVAAIDHRMSAQKQQIDLLLMAEHRKNRKAMKLLTTALSSQSETVKSLTKSLKSTERKYRQARVSLNSYILEQDNLFNMQLQTIDTKRQVMHFLLDYFKTFSKHPCEVNQYGV